MISLLKRDEREKENVPPLEQAEEPSDVEVREVVLGGETFNLDSEESRIHLLQQAAATKEAARLRWLIPAYAQSDEQNREMLLQEIRGVLQEVEPPSAALSENVPPLEGTKSPLGGVRREPTFSPSPEVAEVSDEPEPEETGPAPDVQVSSKEEVQGSTEAEQFLRAYEERLNEVRENPVLHTTLQRALKRVEGMIKEGAGKGELQEAMDRVRGIYESSQTISAPLVPEVPQKAAAEPIKVPVRPSERGIDLVGNLESLDHPDEDEEETPPEENKVQDPWDAVQQHFEKELSDLNRTQKDRLIARLFEDVGEDVVIADLDAQKPRVMEYLSELKEGESVEVKEEDLTPSEVSAETVPEEEIIAVDTDTQQRAEKALEQPDHFVVEQFEKNLNILLDPLFGNRTGFFTSTIEEGSGRKSKQWEYVSEMPMTRAITDGTIDMEELGANDISADAMNDIVRFLKEVRESSDQQVYEGESVEHYLERVGHIVAEKGYSFKRVTH